jgi:hypothetical protein
MGLVDSSNETSICEKEFCTVMDLFHLCPRQDFIIVKTIKVGQLSQSAVENDDGATCTYQIF